MHKCPYCSKCLDCDKMSQGWDNWRRLRFCDACAERRGDEIDYSTDNYDNDLLATAQRHRDKCEEYNVRISNLM